MDKLVLKEEMMRLWKENFHDTDAYVNLVFKYYFNPEYVEFEEREGKLTAAMLAIPYTFCMNNVCIKSVYLCGLSTQKMYRKLGIMSRLIERMAEKMKKKGFVFMFLIPVDAELERYYFDRNFVPSFYRRVARYTSIHNFNRDFEKYADALKDEEKLKEVQYHSTLNTQVFYGNRIPDVKKKQAIVQYIISKDSEKSERGELVLCQSEQQLIAVVEENLLSGGKIYCIQQSDGKVVGVAFAELPEDSSVVQIKDEYFENRAVMYKLRAEVKSDNPDRVLEIFHYGKDTDDDENGKAIWQPTYSSFLPEAPQVGAVSFAERTYDRTEQLETYGMLRILDISEILKFTVDSKADSKYSILTNQETTGHHSADTGHSAEGGCSEKSGRSTEHSRLTEPLISERELAAIIFRKGGGSIGEEVWGIRRIPARISLMLD